MAEKMARIGATAFAVGLLLAGPQAAGVAAADRGDAGDSASTSDDTRGSASDDAGSDDEPGRSLTPRAASDPATEDESDVSDVKVSIDEPDEPDISDLEISVDEPDDDISVDEPDDDISVDEPDDDISVDEPDDDISVDEPDEPDVEDAPDGDAEDSSGSDTIDEVLPLPEDPAVPVEDTGESIPADTESPSEESTEDGDSPDGEDQLILDDPVALEGEVPGLGGPDPLPLPWWRTTTSGGDGTPEVLGPKEPCEDCEAPYVVWLYDGSGDGPVALPVAVPGLSEEEEEEETAVPIADAGDGPAGQVIATVKMKVVEALDLALNWLSGLPTTRFTEFLSGALLLVRRALMPEISQENTGGPGATELAGELPDGLIGLSEAAAVDAAESGGWVARVVARDGEYYPVTKDYLLSRVNLTVVGGTVTSVSVG